MSQLTINTCSQIKCPFFEIQPPVGKCGRYSKPDQCHLTTMFEFESDGYWLFTRNEKALPQIKNVNDRFLSKDKASRRQLEQLRQRSPKLEPPKPEIPKPSPTNTQLQPEA